MLRVFFGPKAPAQKSFLTFQPPVILTKKNFFLSSVLKASRYKNAIHLLRNTLDDGIY